VKVANLTDVKDELSRYVEYVRRGERVRILVRGTPVADLVPVSEQAEGPGEEWTDEELSDLERKGVIRRGSGPFPAELLKPGPAVKGADAVGALIEERARR
jgi:prevent-host-death family protein